MAYYGVLLSTVFVFVFVASILYWYRSQWTFRFSYRGAAGGFQADVEDGLTSNHFDLQPNIQSYDSREGLDDRAKSAIRQIMRKNQMSFDQARLAFFKEQLRSGNVTSDGIPRDPKFVSFEI